MILSQYLLVWIVLACTVMPAQARASDTRLRVTVPSAVAAAAARRAAGDPAATPPILILEGLEFGDGEGLTIAILGPCSPAPVLAVTGIVGHAQKQPQPPL